MAMSISRVSLRRREVEMLLICDGEHGLLDRPRITFKTGNVFLTDQAIKAGWKNSYKNGERLWLCPDCAGRH